MKSKKNGAIPTHKSRTDKSQRTIKASSASKNSPASQAPSTHNDDEFIVIRSTN